MKCVDVVKLEQLPIDDLQPLLEESWEQGYEFLDRLVAEYLSGANQFALPDEALFGIYCDQRLIAIGGLNRDPYLLESDTGRVRHVYVLSAWRGQGIGKLLLQRISDESRLHHRRLTLRALSEQADEFYRGIGFQKARDHWRDSPSCLERMKKAVAPTRPLVRMDLPSPGMNTGEECAEKEMERRFLSNTGFDLYAE